MIGRLMDWGDDQWAGALQLRVQLSDGEIQVMHAYE